MEPRPSDRAAYAEPTVLLDHRKLPALGLVTRYVRVLVERVACQVLCPGRYRAAKVVGTEPGKVLVGYVPGGLERSFEEFAQLRTEPGEGANRSTGRDRTVEEINEEYDSEFVGPPL